MRDKARDTRKWRQTGGARFSSSPPSTLAIAGCDLENCTTTIHTFVIPYVVCTHRVTVGYVNDGVDGEYRPGFKLNSYALGKSGAEEGFHPIWAMSVDPRADCINPCLYELPT